MPAMLKLRYGCDPERVQKRRIMLVVSVNTGLAVPAQGRRYS